MEQQNDHIASLLEKASGYVETRIELAKLKVAEKSSQTISSLVSMIVLCFVIIFFVLLLNIGLALWIGELLGNSYYGFFVLAAFYGLIALLIYFFKGKWIENPITNSIIKKMVK